MSSKGGRDDLVKGEFVDVRAESYYGGRNEQGVLEYLYRMADGRWFLHTLNVAMQKEPTFAEISDDQALAWLIRACREEERAAQEGKHDAELRLVPQGFVSRRSTICAGPCSSSARRRSGTTS